MYFEQQRTPHSTATHSPFCLLLARCCLLGSIYSMCVVVYCVYSVRELFSSA